MINRRDLLRQAAGAGLASAALHLARADEPRRQDDPEVWVNDKQSRLNRTRVARIVQPRSLEEVEATLRAASKEGKALSVCGGRHAMGGQQFGEDAVLLDITAFNRVLNFDRGRGLIEVQGGIKWPELVAYLLKSQEGSDRPWGFRQKQTGVDGVTLGGSLAANAHGRGLSFPPIVADVESFVLVDADGKSHTCSRKENSELFSLAIGGYGLFGVIAQVTLRLVPRVKVQRIVEVIEVRNLLDRVGGRIRDGFTFGDCQYSTDFASDAPHRGVFSCYRPAGADAQAPDDGKKLSDDDWAKLIYLAHADKARAFEAYSAHYLSTSGQVYWSDTHQMSADFDDYHTKLDAQFGKGKAGTEMISEVYLGHDALLPFLKAAAGEVRERGINLIYGTIRFIEKDSDTFLAWAKDRSVCVLCNIHVDHTPEGLEKAASDFRRLIGLAIAHGGRYFLTYHRWASKDQVLAAYPQFIEFLKLKEKYDPEGRFQSNWYRHYRSLFAETLR